MRLLLSCEHASPDIPEPFLELLAGARHLIDSHLSYDLGAAEVCRVLEDLAEAAFYGRCSRLLIDLNRSPHHRRLFSDFSRHLTRAEKEEIVARYYTPFRNAVAAAAKSMLAGGEMAHVSVHSFTPVLDGVVRGNDIGLLYDPGREGERDLAWQLAAVIHRIEPALAVRMNYPYRGTADGHVTALRRLFGGDGYLGLELEINQNLLADDRGRSVVAALLAQALGQCGIGRG